MSSAALQPAMIAAPVLRPGHGAASARSTFLLALAVVLVFSEFWMKPLSGTTLDPSQNPVIRAMYYPGYLAAIALLAFAPFQVLTAVLRTPLLWALVALAFVSKHWSIDGAATERRSIALLLTTLCGVALAVRLDWLQLTRVLATGYLMVCVASVFVALLVPSFGRMQVDFPGAWSGVFIEKNGLGAWSGETMVFCAAAAWLDRPRRWLWVAGVGLGSALLLLSTSKTALVVAMTGGLTLAFAWAVRRGRVAAVGASFAGVTGLAFLGSAVAFAPAVLLGLLGKDATLTGRTRVWAAVLRQIGTRPDTGFGYGAVWSDQTGWGPVYWVIKQAGFRPTYSHNGWLDLWLGLGVYAVWMFAVFLVLTWLFTLATTYRRSDALIALPLVAMFSLNNLTESAILSYNAIGWILFVTVATKVVVSTRAAACRAAFAGGERFSAGAPAGRAPPRGPPAAGGGGDLAAA